MSETKLTVTERNNLTPVCPFCDKELDQVFVKTKGMGMLIGKTAICFCPYCRKVLGFAESRMM